MKRLFALLCALVCVITVHAPLVALAADELPAIDSGGVTLASDYALLGSAAADNGISLYSASSAWSDDLYYQVKMGNGAFSAPIYGLTHCHSEFYGKSIAVGTAVTVRSYYSMYKGRTYNLTANLILGRNARSCFVGRPIKLSAASALNYTVDSVVYDVSESACEVSFTVTPSADVNYIDIGFVSNEAYTFPSSGTSAFNANFYKIKYQQVSMPADEPDPGLVTGMEFVCMYDNAWKTYSVPVNDPWGLKLPSGIVIGTDKQGGRGDTVALNLRGDFLPNRPYDFEIYFGIGSKHSNHVFLRNYVRSFLRFQCRPVGSSSATVMQDIKLLESRYVGDGSLYMRYRILFPFQSNFFQFLFNMDGLLTVDANTVSHFQASVKPYIDPPPDNTGQYVEDYFDKNMGDAVSPELSGGLSDADKLMQQQQQFEDTVMNGLKNSYNQLDFGAITFPAEVLTSITYISTTFMSLYNGLGQYKIVLTFPLFLGLALPFIGRLSQALSVSSMRRNGKKEE